MLKKQLYPVVLASLFAFSASLSPLSAADVNGRIKGTVVDSAGAVVPSATIIATNQNTGVKFSTVTQKDGVYLFPQLPIGTYNITATAPGFKAFSASGIVLNIDQEYIESVQFTSGSASETVSVDADAVQVNTTDSQLNNIVESAQMVELPNISRSFTGFELIEPGVQASSDRFGGYSADGAQTQQSSFLINGADVNDLAINTVGLSPVLDAVAEFNLVTGPLNAEYDRNSGGIVNATLKQGTNAFHGDVYEFYRDTFLNTGGFFQNVAATPTTPQHKNVSPYHENIFGGTLGGPVLKDKLFFFGAYEGRRSRSPNNNSASTTTVFSAAQLAGDFSDDLGTSSLGYSFSSAPIPGTLNIPGCGPVAGVAYTWAACAAKNGGKFPTTSFNPIAAALTAKYVPAANQGTNSYVFNNVAALSQNQYLGRADYAPTTKDQLSVIYIKQKSNTVSTTPFTGATLPGFGELDGNNIDAATVDYVRQLSSSTVNDFAVHYTRFNLAIVNPVNNVDPASLGFSIFPQVPAYNSVPTINTGYFSLGFSTNGPQPRIDQTYQIDDSISKSLGHHSLKFGYDGRKFQVSNPFSANANGAYNYNTGTAFGSGDPGLDFLLGNPASYAQGSGAIIQAYAFLNYFYAQDNWKVTDAFTLNYGLGYQIDTPLHNIQYGQEAIACFIPGQQSNVFANAPIGMNYPGDPGCSNSAQATTRYADFGPRIGFAYAPDLGFLSGGQSKKLSIRGGFGIYYNRTEEETSLNNLQTPPFGQSTSGAKDYGALAPAFANPFQDIDTGQVYKNKFPFTFPVKGQAIDYSIYEPMAFNTYDKNFRSPYAENFELSIERELPAKTIARLSYVGSLAHHNQITYEGDPITAAGHAACLAATKTCGSPTTSGYRDLQNYFYVNHTQYGIIDPNTGIPAYPAIGTVTSAGSSNYHALQASILKTATHGLEFQLSYTLAKAMDDGSGYENSGYGGTTRGYNQFDKTLNYGPSTFDARQRLVFAPVYIVPSLPGHSAFAPINLALSGWQISGISSVATGFPFDISYGGGSSNSLYCSAGFSFYACPDEPNQTGPLVRSNPRTFVPGTNRTQWFSAAASGLSQAPLGSFGNESRDRYHGPGLINTDLILAKNFNLNSEGTRRLQIRMESDNVFNHTNFNNPNSTVSSTVKGETLATPGTLSYGSAGQITTAAQARRTQLAAKIYF